MKVIERIEGDYVPHFKLGFSLDERARLRVHEGRPSEIQVGDELLRFVPGRCLRRNGIDFHIQDVISVTSHFMWATIAPSPNVGDELEVA